MTMLEPLEVAERRCDRVLNDPTSTYEQRLQAISALCRRGWADPDTAEQVIRQWVAESAPRRCDA
jgi:hypothetical protein